MSNTQTTIKSGSRLKSTRALIIFSAIDSAAILMLSWFIYSKFYYRIPKYITIGIIFSVVYLVLSSVIICWFGIKSIRIKQAIKIVPYAILTFILSAVLQWLYGLNFPDTGTGTGSSVHMASSYVFIIDDSGSTQFTDSYLYRYIAVSSIMQDKAGDVQYMVYSFGTNTICSREMSPKGDEIERMTARASGETNIRSALKRAVTDYNDGKWNSAENPEVILISDGYATDITSFYPLHVVLNEFVSAGISVSTIGFDNCDKELLALIAENTGGVYFDAGKASGLFDAMRYVEANPVRKMPESRDLLSFRMNQRHNILYCIERILFLSFIAIMLFRFAVAPCILYEASYYIAAFDYIKIIVCAILFEFGIKFLHFPLLIFWALYFVFCFGFLVLEKYEDDGSTQ